MPRHCLRLSLTALLLLLMACAPAARSGAPATPDVPPGGAGTSRTDTAPAPITGAEEALCAPLLLESDYGFGTHVVMRRLPTAADLEDLRFMSGLRQVLIALPAWPAGYDELRQLQQAIRPEGVELVVLLPGWPPTREALGAWNLVGGSLRLILVVDGPPADRALIAELNRLRPLERVIAQMKDPARSGFERLQRPLSFRVLRN